MSSPIVPIPVTPVVQEPVQYSKQGLFLTISSTRNRLFQFDEPEDVSLECLALEDYIADGRLDVCKLELSSLLVQQPMNAYIHLLLGKVALAEANYDVAAYHVALCLV